MYLLTTVLNQTEDSNSTSCLRDSRDLDIPLKLAETGASEVIKYRTGQECTQRMYAEKGLWLQFDDSGIRTRD